MIIENLIITRVINGIEMRYTYKLLKASYNGMQAYGIEVDRTDIKAGTIVNVITDRVDLISPYRYKVRELLDMLYKGEVSPIHLIDIIGEYVDEYSYDFDNYQEINERIIG